MPESLEPLLREKLEALAAKVREASSRASVVRLDEVWAGPEGEFLKSAPGGAVSGFEDIALIRDSGFVYLYSERHMTRPYAEAVSRSRCEDKRHAIAETVRADSLTYPRPTAVTSFSEPPFHLSPETLHAAVEGILNDPGYADIRLVQASDGSQFLFSSNHMHPAHAASLAEWIAVERFNSV